MARIRTIKPEFWTSKTLANISRECRLTFIGLWSLCDDIGVMLDTPKKIAGDLYPWEGITGNEIDDQLKELEANNLILRVTENNKNFIIIRSWDEHQKVDRPSKFCYLSRDYRDELALGKGKREKGKGKREAVKGKREITSPVGDEEIPEQDVRLKKISKNGKPPSELDLLKAHGVNGQISSDFLKLRSKKRQPLTPSAMDGIVSEAERAGISVLEAITVCCRKSWAGFDSTWNYHETLASIRGQKLPKSYQGNINAPRASPAKGVMPKPNYGEYTPSESVFNEMKIIDGERIYETQ